MKTKTIFRRYPSGEVIALFPELPDDLAGRLCLSYQHTGQHSGADCCGVIHSTRAASPAEYASLARELEGRGYALQVIHRTPQNAQRVRLLAMQPARA